MFARGDLRVLNFYVVYSLGSLYAHVLHGRLLTLGSVVFFWFLLRPLIGLILYLDALGRFRPITT